MEASNETECQQFIKNDWSVNSTHGIAHYLYQDMTRTWSLKNLTCQYFGTCKHHNIQWECIEVGGVWWMVACSMGHQHPPLHSWGQDCATHFFLDAIASLEVGMTLTKQMLKFYMHKAYITMYGFKVSYGFKVTYDSRSPISLRSLLMASNGLWYDMDMAWIRQKIQFS